MTAGVRRVEEAYYVVVARVHKPDINVWISSVSQVVAINLSIKCSESRLSGKS